LWASPFPDAGIAPAGDLFWQFSVIVWLKLGEMEVCRLEITSAVERPSDRHTAPIEVLKLRETFIRHEKNRMTSSEKVDPPFCGRRIVGNAFGV
jgi:hypothetical protein